MKTCAAPECGRPLAQRSGESPSAFMARKTCGGRTGGDCGQKLAVFTRTTTTIEIGTDKHCAICSALLTRRSRESLKQFANRKACSNKCRAKLRTTTQTLIKIEGDKHCKICGALLERHPNEDLYAFVKRKTCGKSCTIKLRSTIEIVPGRRCTACTALLVQRDDEDASKFMRRKTCNNACRYKSISRAVIVDDRRCPVCDEVLRRRKNETPRYFMKRKTCGEACGGQANRTVIDFYGALLPASEIAKILDVSRQVLRRRRRAALRASVQKERV